MSDMREVQVPLATLVTTVIVSVCLSVIVTLMVQRFLMTPPQAETKIRVVDLVGLSMAAADRFKTTEEGDVALQSVFDQLKALQEQGYIILNSQQVMAAPHELVLDADQLLPPSVQK